MKKSLSTLLLAAVVLAGCQQQKTDGVFEPYASTDLRLPSVPLVVNDPYFSVWSPYDKLTDENVPVKWTSSDKKVAKVSSKGVVTGVKKGKATVTAKLGKKKYSCKVTVNDTYGANTTSISIPNFL